MIIKYIKKYGELIRYLIVGGLTTLVALVVYYSCVYSFLNPDIAFELQVANVISWFVAVIFAFFTNRYFVFKSKNKEILKESITFFNSRLVTLLIDMFLMFIFVTVLHFNDKIIKIPIQIIVIILNYVFSKIFVFKNKK